MKKENNAIYVKQFNYIVLLTILNSENIIYVPIEKNIVRIFLKNIMQSIQLKKKII